MADNKDLLKKSKLELLTELESIQTLLDDDNSSGDSHTDNIPVLQDAIIEERAEISSNGETDKVRTESEQFIDTNTHDMDDYFVDQGVPEDKQPIGSEAVGNGVLPGQQSLFNDSSKTSKNDQSQSSLSQNPFLPPHVRERFTPDAEEETSNMEGEPSISNEQGKTKELPINASYTERLVDQLVAHHLPRIEAQLRKRLLDVVKLHNERLKK